MAKKGYGRKVGRYENQREKGVKKQGAAKD